MTTELIAAIRRGPDAVVAELAGRSEEERRAAARRLLKLFRASQRDWSAGIGPDGELVPNGKRRWEQREALQVALLGVATGSELRKLGKRAVPADHNGGMEAAYAVLADRRPPWLVQWAEMVLDDHGWFVYGAWPLVRRLIRDGLMERPDSDAYVRALVPAMWTHQQGVRAELEADPDLLEWEVWRLFEVEAGEVCLATIDGGAREGWSSGLVALAAEGRLDRGRLLDASLAALARDFSAHQAGWFSRFHEALTPTAEERAARADAYLGLLASPAPSTVTFAVKALVKTPAVEPAALIDALPAALASDRKGVVRDALKLLDRLGGEERAVAAAAALQHPAPDIQLRALELIGRWTGGEPGEVVRAELLAYAEVVAPTARRAFDALTGAPEAGAAEPADLPALEARAGALPAEIRAALGVDAALAAAAGQIAALPSLPARGEPVLTGLAPVAPVADLDALTDVLGRVIEGGAPQEECERALDGISRFCHDRAPFERELKPLLARLEQVGPLSPVSRAVAAWASGRVPRGFDNRDFEGWWGWAFLDARVGEVAKRAAALQPAPLLAMPTHHGCLLDPAVLVERVTALPGAPGRFDLVQALHRIARDGRADALTALPGEAGAAIGYALGGPAPHRADPFALAAAWAVREGDDPPPQPPRLSLRRRPAASARYTFTARPSEDVDFRHDFTIEPPPGKAPLEQPAAWLPALVAIRADLNWSDLSHAAVRVLLGTWPRAEVLAALGAAELMPGEYTADSLTGGSEWVAALAPPGTPVGGTGALLIALALIAEDKLTATAAQETLAAAIADGRLDAPLLTQPLRFLYDHGWAHASRLGRRLAPVAALSPLHGETVRLALEGMLSGDAAGAPRDLHALLEPLNELAEAAGAAVCSPAARALLEGFSGRSKTARLAAALLAREGDSALAGQAAAAAAEARIARGEAWAAK